MRTFNGWGEVSTAGWMEIDLVAHCGKWMEGRFLWTLVATDISAGWSECLPLLNRDRPSVMAALRMLEELLPFPLRGIDVDNDGAFLNTPLKQWCAKHQPPIVLTRSRAYQSNDQAWVEQKNGMLIRRVVGYQRLEGLVAAEVMGELYGALRLFTNLYQPSFKLKETIREGAKLKRRHHPPRTPMQRLLAQDMLSIDQRTGLEGLQNGCDPLALLETTRRAQATLASLSAGHRQQEPGRARGPVDPEQVGKEQHTLSRFLRNPHLLWNESQPKPEPKKKRRYTPRQRTLFAEHQEQIEQWLESDVAMSAAEILRRLMALAPESYHEGQQRSMERRVREWRAARAERLLAGMRSTATEAGTEERKDRKCRDTKLREHLMMQSAGPVFAVAIDDSGTPPARV